MQIGWVGTGVNTPRNEMKFIRRKDNAPTKVMLPGWISPWIVAQPAALCGFRTDTTLG